MKITLEHLGNRIQVEDEEAVDITDVIELFEHALVKVGFEEERIKAAIQFRAGSLKNTGDDPTTGESESKYLF